MARKLSEYRIASDLAEALKKRIVGACIRDLQGMREHLLSGEDSGLANVWDEICVQEQKERSFDWEAYEETMSTFIECRVSELQPYELDALWLLTPQGDDWDCEPDDTRESYPVVQQDVEDYLAAEMLTAANNWSNARISKYLERGYECRAIAPTSHSSNK